MPASSVTEIKPIECDGKFIKARRQSGGVGIRGMTRTSLRHHRIKRVAGEVLRHLFQKDDVWPC